MSYPSDDIKTQSNRANAQLSTGPKTPAGKAVSSLNGTTHGLAANRISPKNPEGLAKRKSRIDAYTTRYNPCGTEDPILADLIEDLATARVRKDLIEDRLAELPDETSHHFQLLQRYLRDADRCYYRALREIEALQSRRDTSQDRKIRLRIEANRVQAKIYMQETEFRTEQYRAPLASLRQEIDSLLNGNPPSPPADPGSSAS